MQYDREGSGYLNVNMMDNFVDELEQSSTIITTTIKKDPHRRRMFVSSLQVPSYNKFSHYYF